jgi:tetratricopeptide (TPR) repeat protein
MNQVLHKSADRLAENGMVRIFVCCLVLLAWFGIAVPTALAGGQGYPGSGGQMPGGGGRPGMGQSQPGGENPSTPQSEKPDAAAKKAFKAGLKSLNRARELEDAAAKVTNPDKKADALDKVGDTYNRALDQFTEALSNKGDMVEAWNNVGFIHLRLGAYNESIDDYNHALALKADLLDAVEGRGEAYMAVDRLDQAKAAYMDLFNHSRPLADQLMASMQKWLESHRVAANGMRAADIDSFGKWLRERDEIAKPTAAAGAPAAAPNPP